MPILYEAVNVTNGCCYVGITSVRLSLRKRQHERDAENGGTRVFSRAIRKYGADAFAWRHVATLPTMAEARIAERIQIALRLPAYNMTMGGDGAGAAKRGPRPPVTTETRAKLSVAAKRVNSIQYAQPFAQTPMARAKRAAAHRGRRRSEGTGARISAATKGLKKPPMSPEHREKLRAAALRQWATRRGV